MALTQVPIELSSTPGIVDNSNDTAITIDSSENVLVGKTSASTNTVGVEARADGTFAAVKSSGGAVVFGRNTDDGTIVTFRKDGTAVGSIQSRAGVVSTIILDPRTNGAGLTGSTNGLIPVNQAGSTADNHVDLGSSSSRFKDLYLSGGAYIGGTGSANFLDDYEEGTWTPAYAFSTSGSVAYGVQNGRYVKVGRLVHVNFRIYTASISSPTGDVTISGLPFTANHVNAGVAIGQVSAFSTNIGSLRGQVEPSSSEISLLKNDTNANANSLQGSDFDGSNIRNVIDGSLTYYTDS
jgi:hypothetical protein